LDMICSRMLNVKQTDELIEFMLTPKKMSKKKKAPVRVFKDVRIFVNTIKQAVDIMKQAGIDAVSEKTENDEYIEYTVRIPK